MKYLDKWGLKSRIIIITISFISLVVFFDKLIFDDYYFKFPNELEWDTSPWYNFSHKTKNQKTFSYFEDGVFIAGSSVAQYSTLPSKIEELMNRTHDSNRTYKVEFFSHVAMSPTDLYHYLDNLISKNPKLVVYPINTGDFQMDYFNLTPELKLNGYNEEIRALDYSGRFPVRTFYAMSFLKKYYPYLKKYHIFHLLTKSLLNINRNRLFFWDPIFAYYERHYRKGRSFHNYTGSVPNEGIWIKGWTKSTFTIHCELTGGNLDEMIFIPNPDTELKIYEEGKEVYSNIFKKTGWQKLFVEFNKTDSLKLLLFNTNKTISSRVIDPKSFAKEQFYGIRLSQNFCKKELEENIAYRRPKALEDISLSEMSPEEYKDDYFRRMYFVPEGKERLEIGRQVNFRNLKIAFSKESEFKPWVEFEYLEMIREKLNKKGIPFVIINNPENPYELEVYRNSIWYDGYLKYLKSMDDGVNTFFYDLSEYLEDPRLFLDSHHLSYIGASRMSPTYSEIFRRHVGKE